MQIDYTVFTTRIGNIFAACTTLGLCQLHVIRDGEIEEVLEGLARAYPKATIHSSPKPLVEVQKEIKAYLAGSGREFLTPLDLRGTPFQKAVWEELCKIPYGETRAYGQIAAQVGNPLAARAVGMACNRNPVAIIVPCHRVVGSDGRLVGYAGGLDIKGKLLDLELA
jgi:methylated-DNA-[protein]-cysteine S-methyltransferase